MDHQNKIRQLCKNSNHVLKLQIDENIKELLLKELKVKQKILNKQMNKSKLRKKNYIEHRSRNFNMKVVYLHVFLVIIYFKYFILKCS